MLGGLYKLGKEFSPELTKRLCSNLSFSTPETARHFEYLTDLQNPESWYPTARQITRKIIAHVGPTNSGKSHAALTSLQNSRRGVYCGPLRLLAQEVSELLNKKGVPCDLLTGQEVRKVKGAKHVACTVEMASIQKKVEVAVIDEIQMIGDFQRGWNFARTLLGIPADVIHVCGDPASIQLVQQLARDCADEFEIRTYERLVPLLQEEEIVPNLGKVQKGDCVVAFSRQQIYQIKYQIEQLSGRHCAVIYGSLPPEARTQQARLFNDPNSIYNVLVASDAIGMGLNLNIRRIVFSTTEKFNGQKMSPLKTMEIKQIAGRAGRFGISKDNGLVGCLKEEDKLHIINNLQKPTPSIQKACLLPPFEKLSEFANHFTENNFANAIKQFSGQAQLSSYFFMGDVDRMYKIANMLRHLPLKHEDTYVFCCSPCDPEDAKECATLLEFATAYVHRGDVGIHSIKDPFLKVPKTSTELRQLEITHELYELYLWLSYRFPIGFKDREIARERCELCTFLIAEGLEYLTKTSVVEKQHIPKPKMDDLLLDPRMDLG